MHAPTEQEQQSMTETQLKAYEQASPQTMETYRKRVLLIVNDSLEASSQTATLPEKMSRAEVWARLLFGIIPANELQIAFDRAFAKHTTPFPVNAYDVKLAWESFDAAHIKDQARRAARERRTKESSMTALTIQAHGYGIAKRKTPISATWPWPTG